MRWSFLSFGEQAFAQLKPSPSFFWSLWWKNPSFDKLAVILMIYFTGIWIHTHAHTHTHTHCKTGEQTLPVIIRQTGPSASSLWCPWHIIFWMVSSNPMQNSFFSTVSRWQMEEIKFNSFRVNLNGCERLASLPAFQGSTIQKRPLNKETNNWLPPPPLFKTEAWMW